MLRWVLGARALAPGWSSALIQPQLGPLAWANGAVATPRGAITLSVAQALDARTQLPTAFALNLTVPGAVSVRACLPATACGAGAAVRVDGAAAAGALVGDYACVELTAGAHQLVCPV
jgi:alpha-L-rhamnosidase